MKIRLPSNRPMHGITTVLAVGIVLVLFINGDVYGQKRRYSDYCLSINKELGKCVPLQTCPLFLGWLRQRPIVKSNIKLVVEYTCLFDLKQPKVCCPVKDIDSEGNLIVDKIGFNSEEEPQNSVGDSSRSVSLTQVSSTTVPDLLFPSENPQSDFKRPSKIKQHPNFHLMPSLNDCSRAVKLDRLFGTYGTHPWMALIGYREKFSGKFHNVCAGTVINKRYILTSAHCPYESGHLITYVRLGEYNLDTELDQGTRYLPPSSYVEYKIEKILPHIGFHKTRRNNDIALIRVEKDIDFNSIFVKPVCLPYTKEYGLSSKTLEADDLNRLIDQKAVVAGWGKTTWNANGNSRVLKEAPVQFSPYDVCEDAYSNQMTIQYKQFCIGGRQRDSSCVTDSGGPLLLPIPLNTTRLGGFATPRMFQLGILSYGPSSDQCQEFPLPPSVYTKVHPYLDWILKLIEP